MVRKKHRKDTERAALLRNPLSGGVAGRATAVAQPAGVGIGSHYPPQGLTALAPPRRGFSWNPLPQAHTTPLERGTHRLIANLQLLPPGSLRLNGFRIRKALRTCDRMGNSGTPHRLGYDASSDPA